MNEIKYDISKFLTGLDQFSITLSDKKIQQFIKYYELLIDKNKVMNLTAITEFEDVIEKHFLDSLSLIRVLDLNQNIHILDMGTGAGFPGIPLKIAFPNLRITLADSLNKRIMFLHDVINELSLDKIYAVHCRAEDLAANKKFRESFDVCVSRAVANLSTLSEYCIPFVKKGGKFISYKSGEYEVEVKEAIKAISIMGGDIAFIDKFTIGESSRSFIVIDKVKNTPRQYPRKAGTPSKNPIKG